MKILALDMATYTGFASGLAGEKPVSGTVPLKKRGEDWTVATERLGCWIRDQFSLTIPDVCIYEAPINIGGMMERDDEGRIIKMRSNPETISLLIGVVGSLHGVAACYGVRPIQVHSATWRKHFLGTSRLGGRDAAKEAAIKQCHVLGYLPLSIKDDNRADACGIWDFASAKYGRAVPKSLQLF